MLHRMHSSRPDLDVKVFYYVFDIIYLEGYDLSAVGLRHRKALLKEALTFEHRYLRFTRHRNRIGEEFLEEAREMGWDGLIAKDGNSGYQELVICGYTEPGGSRKHFGALVVGYYEQGKLKHAGKVGTGYDRATTGCGTPHSWACVMIRKQRM